MNHNHNFTPKPFPTVPIVWDENSIPQSSEHLLSQRMKAGSEPTTGTNNKESFGNDFISFDFVGIDNENSENENVSASFISKKRKFSQEKVQSNQHTRQVLSLNILTSLPLPPWVNRDYPENGLEFLNQEIHDYVSYMKPTQIEKFMREFVVDQIRVVVQMVYPDATVHVFGSLETNLYLPSRFLSFVSAYLSDIDVVVISKAAQTPQCLRKVAKKLKEYKMCDELLIIEKAKVAFLTL